MHTGAQESDNQVQQQRLAALEQALGRYRLLAVIALVLAVVGIGLAAWQTSRIGMQARSFSLIDGQGKVRAELALSDHQQPGVFIYGEEGNTRIWLGLHESGKPRLMLGDEEGKPRSILGLNNEGEPRLEFSNDQGQLLYQAPPSFGNTAEERWTNLNTAATRAFMQGRLGEAQKLYLAAMQQARQFGDTDLRLAATLNNLGVVYLKAEDTERAEKAYDMALAIREKMLGDEHPQVAQSLGNLGLLRKAQQRFDESEELYRRSLGILEKAFGAEDVRLANTLKNYVDLLRSQDRDDEADTLQQRLDRISAKAAESGEGTVESP